MSAAQGVCSEPAYDFDNLTSLLERLRSAQRDWAATALRRRLAAVRQLRHEIAGSGKQLCSLFPSHLVRNPAESLTSEIIPLAEACRFLEREAADILAPLQVSTRSRPFWLRRVEVEIRREPLGVILIIGPANYPLFLAGVQVIQSLVAGDAVLLKPGRGAAPLAAALRAMALRAGIPGDVFHVLGEEPEIARAAIDSGVDKIILTGSVESGRSVYRQAAQSLTPVVMELSGDDPVFILPGADLPKAARAIAFGLQLNGGATCIAPRRVFVWQEIADPFERLFTASAKELGANVPVTRVLDEQDALRKASGSRYALGASVFGTPQRAASFAHKIAAGVVVINDMIVPTADPRIPFGGRQLSGFGVTRGAEGLLECTSVKAVVHQNARRLRHLEPPPANAEDFFNSYLTASHGKGFVPRLHGWRALLAAASSEKRKDK